MEPFVTSLPEDIARFKSPARRNKNLSTYEIDYEWRGLVDTDGSHAEQQEVHPTHVDPSHFTTSQQADYKAPGEESYQRNMTPGRAPAELRHVDPSHFTTSQQADYKAPGEESYQRNRTPGRAPAELRHVDPSHFTTSQQADYKAPGEESYLRNTTPRANEWRQIGYDPNLVVASRRADSRSPQTVVDFRSPTPPTNRRSVVNTADASVDSISVSGARVSRTPREPSLDRRVQSSDRFITTNERDYPKYDAAVYAASGFSTPRITTRRGSNASLKPEVKVTQLRHMLRPVGANVFETSAIRKFCGQEVRAQSNCETSAREDKCANQSQSGESRKSAPKEKFSTRDANSSLRHVDPSHFTTSKQADYRAPSREALLQNKSAPRERKSIAPTRVDPSHFLTSNARDFVPHARETKLRGSNFPARGLSADNRNFSSEYSVNYTPKVSPPRTRPAQFSSRKVTHVDPSHFQTSKQRDFAPPPASAYRSASASLSIVREQRSVTKSSVEHYVSESRRAYGGIAQ